MLAADRRRETYDLIERKGSASVTDLAKELDVSVQTVRRDLEALEDEGLIERVHGGAVVARTGRAAGGGGDPMLEHAALERGAERAEEKRRIGAAAAALVQPGSTIFLSGGTTTEQVVAHLPE